jgi:Fur family transcriptional regulator, ferric uptake regulator
MSACDHHLTHKNALEKLKKSSLKTTDARKAIIDVLAHEHGPFTSEEVYHRIKQGRKKEICDLVTVYRCLANFEKIGLVRRCDFGDGSCRYELDVEDHHHHHIICKECRKVELLDICLIDGLERLVREKGYHNVTHALEFFGVCSACHEKV